MTEVKKGQWRKWNTTPFRVGASEDIVFVDGARVPASSFIEIDKRSSAATPREVLTAYLDTLSAEQRSRVDLRNEGVCLFVDDICVDAGANAWWDRAGFYDCRRTDWQIDTMLRALRTALAKPAPQVADDFATCDKHGEMELVRPGKWQCHACEGADRVAELGDDVFENAAEAVYWVACDGRTGEDFADEIADVLIAAIATAHALDEKLVAHALAEKMQKFLSTIEAEKGGE